MRMRCLSTILLTSAICLPGAAGAGDIVGRASVIDGDTIEIRGQRIRLHGIDAPESYQFCERDQQKYRCGQESALALADFLGERTVACSQQDRDRYGRIIAVCSVAGENIGRWMVRNGHAIAYRRYSRDYVDDEQAAREAGAGIWAGRFDEPAAYRRGKRTVR